MEKNVDDDDNIDARGAKKYLGRLWSNRDSDHIAPG